MYVRMRTWEPQQVMIGFHSDSCLYCGLRFLGRGSQDVGTRVRCTKEWLVSTAYPSVWSNSGNKNGVFPLCLIWWRWRQYHLEIFSFDLCQEQIFKQKKTYNKAECTLVLPALRRGLWALGQPGLYSEPHLQWDKSMEVWLRSIMEVC